MEEQASDVFDYDWCLLFCTLIKSYSVRIKNERLNLVKLDSRRSVYVWWGLASSLPIIENGRPHKTHLSQNCQTILTSSKQV